MKKLIFSLLFAAHCCWLFAQAPAQLTYEQFASQLGVQKHEAYFNIYQKNDRFCLEIPFTALGKDVLVSAQAIGGYGSYVSPASDVVRFERHDDYTLYMRRNRSLDVQADSADVPMTDAIRNSTMLPIDRTFTIMTLGESGLSYIVDITADINQSGGLFDVSKYSALSHPDPQRSGVTAVRPVRQGVAIQLFRSQTDNMPVGDMTNMQDVAQTLQLEFILQQLPERHVAMVAESPAYGFQTVSRQEYDMRNYGSRRINYICKWNFADSPLTVFIDPLAPAPFQQSARNAVAQWQQALAKAGVRQAFRVTTDPAERQLSYGHIILNWGSAANGSNSSTIIDPLTGEIIAARLNFMDATNNDHLLTDYYIQCRHLDKRIAADLNSLDVRRDLLTSQIAAELAKVLGMRPNWRTLSAFTPEQLCSSQWLIAHGPVASVSVPLTYNYLPGAKSGVKASGLLPCVSDYDVAALRYAYAKGKRQPADRCLYYSSEDKGDPYATTGSLSSDVLKASVMAIDNLRESYARLHTDFDRLPQSQNNYAQESKTAVRHLAKLEQYLGQIASLVGGRSRYPIIRGVSEQPVAWVPREQQLAALDYLENNILNGVPQWVLRPEIMNICSGNMSSMSIGTANGVLKQLMSADVLQRLVEQERAQGDKAYTAAELTAFIDRVVFHDFSDTMPVSDFRQKTQIALMLSVAEYVAQHNIVMGMQHEGNCLLQVWLTNTARRIATLAQSHADAASRAHFDLLRMRLDKMYFNKPIQ